MAGSTCEVRCARALPCHGSHHMCFLQRFSWSGLGLAFKS